MIAMEMLGKVRRMYLRDNLLLHEIQKGTGLSRTTLRKWVRVPEESVAPPRYQRVQKPTMARNGWETELFLSRIHVGQGGVRLIDCVS